MISKRSACSLLLSVAAMSCAGPPPPAPRPLPPATASAAASAHAVPPRAVESGPTMLCGKLVHRETVTLECEGSVPSIGALRELRVLSVIKPKKLDLSGLRGHPSLRKLTIAAGDEAADLTAIGTLKSLESLVVLGNLGGRIAPLLRGLPALRRVHLGKNVTDLRALATLPHLEHLSIDFNGKPLDLTQLRGATQLRTLSFNQTTVRGLAGLRGNDELTKVTLLASKGTDLAALHDLPALRELHLRSDGEGLDGLAKLTRLKKLDVEAPHPRQLAELEKLAQLEWLTLHSANPDDVRSASKLPRLTSLQIDSTHDPDLLAKFPALTSLSVGYVRPPHAGKLSKLSRLLHFGYESAHVAVDLSGMTALRSVSVPSVEAGGIDRLSALQEVELQGASQAAGGSLMLLARVKGLRTLTLARGKHHHLASLAPLRLEKVTAQTVTLDVTNLHRVNALRTLDAGLVPVGKLAELGRATQLTNLAVTSERFGEAEALQRLVALRKLTLRGEVRSLNGLRGMKHLEELTIVGSRIEVDIAAVADLPKLTRLKLVGTNLRPGGVTLLKRLRPGCELVVQ